MGTNGMYSPTYNNSWALIIGINAYPMAPLSYARHDAEAIQKIFIEKFNFSAENIITLVDEAATRSAMDEVFLTLRVKINSR